MLSNLVDEITGGYAHSVAPDSLPRLYWQAGVKTIFSRDPC